MSKFWTQNAGLIGVDGSALFGVHNLKSARQRVLDGNWTNQPVTNNYTPTNETATFTESGSPGTHLTEIPQDLSLTYRTWAECGTTLTSGSSYTFSSVSIGTASSNRWVIVGVAYYTDNNTNVSTVTVGGTGTSTLGSQYQSTTAGCVIKAGNITSGTTADIVVNVTTAPTSWDVAIAVWTVETASLFYNGDGSISGGNLSLTSLATGQPIVGVGINVNGAAGTSSISNTTSFVERADNDIRSGEYFCAVEGLSGAFGGGTHTVDIGSSSRLVAVALSNTSG